ncbi:hypothetical protein CRH03_12655 [Clostridium sp. HMb25]|nr:hypothetical protein CRH03_12655 [Clostridium sp. HMb25]
MKYKGGVFHVNGNSNFVSGDYVRCKCVGKQIQLVCRRLFAGREAAGCIPGSLHSGCDLFRRRLCGRSGAEAYSSGMIAWYNGLAGAVGILAVCLVLKKMEGMQLYTVAELLETRYGSPLLRFLCAMLSLLALIGILSGQVNSAGSILSSIGIGSPVVGGLIAAAFFIGYTVVGGLWAVTITDFIQIIVAGAGIIAATFFTVNKLGAGAVWSRR